MKLHVSPLRHLAELQGFRERECLSLKISTSGEQLKIRTLTLARVQTPCRHSSLTTIYISLNALLQSVQCLARRKISMPCYANQAMPGTLNTQLLLQARLASILNAKKLESDTESRGQSLVCHAGNLSKAKKACNAVPFDLYSVVSAVYMLICWASTGWKQGVEDIHCAK